MGDEETNSTEDSTSTTPLCPKTPPPTPVTDTLPVPIQRRPPTPPLSLSQTPGSFFFSPRDEEKARQREFILRELQFKPVQRKARYVSTVREHLQDEDELLQKETMMEELLRKVSRAKSGTPPLPVPKIIIHPATGEETDDDADEIETIFSMDP
ncbi:hypothetical protein [Legionella oakridgensis]|uniref:Uncharacterized protein n=2 Tax=Legionella oakridgensis TaxID=29423 RepID=W0BAX3_9GAMM|nr:hypothetical protein [Legionella oakridgensis]AHE65747.1 hypothetical protein Loa_00156 [Legionella oakridgensis ATCC 33761 = DSM 21215]ETO94396.1 hypothetical protein LOR_55c11810 [Legionella oakridgensis RV-2-2007]KTD38180.1 hypothetical protein Loak_1856 [Legionella oakridgensis]STY15690.1 Uncharacterised protein [Legionella longbeachae]